MFENQIVIRCIALLVATLCFHVTPGASESSEFDELDDGWYLEPKESHEKRRGPRGPRGHHGKQGKRGHHGSNGTSGRPGATGATGATGTAGAPGASGTPGPTGATGATGSGSGFGPFANIYQQGTEVVSSGASFTFDHQNPSSGFTFLPLVGPPFQQIQVITGGTYVIRFTAYPSNLVPGTTSIALLQKIGGVGVGTEIPGSEVSVDQLISGSGTVPLSGEVTVTLSAGDTVELANIGTTATFGGIDGSATSADITIQQVQ